MLKAKPCKKQIKIVVVAGTISVLLLIASVSFAQDNGPNAGAYTSSIAATEIPAGIPTEARPIFVGEWTMNLGDDHRYRIAKDGKVLVEGHFDSSAKEIRFTDESGDLACAAEMKTGSYHWVFEDKKLTFTSIGDDCDGRRLVLTVHPWTQPATVRETTIRESPPTPKPTPPEDTGRYVDWFNKRGKSFSDRPHEEVSLRIGDWGFFYHGDRPVGGWTPLTDRTGLDRNGHAVTEAENSDWYAFLGTSGLDASAALRRVAWLLNADGVFPDSEPQTTGGMKIAAPTLISENGTITFQGSCEAHSDPPYKMHVTIVAATNGNRVQIEPGK